MAATDPSVDLGPIPSKDFTTAVMLRMVAAAERTALCLAQLTTLAEQSQECSERSEKLLIHLAERMEEHDSVVRGAAEAAKHSHEYIRAALTPWYKQVWGDFKENPIPFILIVLMLIVTLLVTVGPLRVQMPVGSGGTIESRQPAVPNGAPHPPVRSE